MNELNKLYKAMLLSWGAVVNDSARILFQVYGPDNKIEEVPLRIDGHDLFLPLSEVLEGDCNDKVFFHPACENILSKETEVFKLIRRMTVMKLLTTFRMMPVILAKVADAKEKKAWKQDVLNMLEPIKHAKKATLVELGKLFGRMHVELEEDGLDNRFVHLKISKGGARATPNSPRVYYKTKPSFPFYNEISKRLAHSEGSPDNHLVEINNHSFSRGCLKLAQHIFQVILPVVMSPDEAEFESTDPVAARMVSYLGCYVFLAEQVNKVLAIFRQDFDKAGVYQINVDWTEYFENLPETYLEVPTLDYNSHNVHEEVENNNFGRSDMGGLLSVSRQAQQVQPPGLNNQQQQQQQVYNNQQLTPTGFNTARPMMEFGDTYQRYEIDYNTPRILHFAVDGRGNQVVYECTKSGNMLSRMVMQPGMTNMMGSMIPGNNMNPMMMGMNPMMNMNMGMMAGMTNGGPIQLPNGMVAMPVGNGYYRMPDGSVVPGPGAQTSTAGGGGGGGNMNLSADVNNGSFGLY